MIYVKISGGLGNQLFQYAFGQYVAEKLNTEVIYHAQTQIDNKNFTKRNLDIQNFDLPIDFVKDEKSFHHIKSLSKYKRKLIQLFPFVSSGNRVQSTDIHKPEKKLIDNCYYEGYWQNPSYPDAIAEMLKSKIVLSDASLQKLQHLITQIESQNSTSIHIRRGDYINIPGNSTIYNICGMDYYDKAIQYIKSKTDNPKFFIFTEDLDWAKENFVGEEFCFVTGNSAIEDMILMSKCKNQIIANSTFSWWSAWLNKNNDKMVIAPKNWYVNFLQNQLHEFLPKNWIKL